MRWGRCGFLAILSLVFLAGCQRQTLQVVWQPEELALAYRGDSKWTVDCERSLALVYCDAINAGRLTERQFNDLLELIEAASIPRESIWFVWVEYCGDAGRWGDTDSLVSVYLFPSERGERIRKGKRFSILGRFGEPRRAGVGMSKEEIRQYGSFLRDGGVQYYQVSLPGEAFTDEIRVPIGSLMPFTRSTGLSDEEIIEISDYARTYLTTKVDKIMLNRNGACDPICSISVNKDDAIEVWFGLMPYPGLCGGTYIHLKRSENGFEAISYGSWSG